MRVKITAIVLGAVVDIGGSFAAALVLNVAVKVHDRAATVPLAVSYGVGLAFSLLGGLVAGRRARQRELLHGLATAVPCFLLAVILPSPTTSLGRWVFDHFAMFPFAALGGYLSRRWNRGT